MIERTLVLFKPDAVQRAISGELLTRFEKSGLKIAGMKMVWVDKAFSRKHYSAHVNKAFYQGLEDFITAGPVIAVCFEGVSAVEVVRKIVGPTEPKSAPPGTIRGDFAHMSYTYADNNNRAIPNLIHASGNREEAISELGLWFSDKELHSYNTVHDSQVI